MLLHAIEDELMSGCQEATADLLPDEQADAPHAPPPSPIARKKKKKKSASSQKPPAGFLARFLAATPEADPFASTARSLTVPFE